MKNKYLFVFLLLSFLSLASLGIAQRGVNTVKLSDEVVIVTSFYPTYITTLNLTDGLDGVRVESLTQPTTGCLHDYQLTPDDMKLINGADVLIVNGGGMEGFLEDVIVQYPNLEVIIASQGIPLLENSEEVWIDSGAHTHEHEHSQESLNSHVWMNLNDYEKQVTNIADGLAKADMKHAVEYENNSNTYKEKLVSLQEDVEHIKEKPHKVIVFHNAFAYLADMLEFPVKGGLDMDENTSLSASQISQVMDCVKQEGAELLFAEERYGQKLAQTVESETDGKVLFLDTLVSGQENKDAYINGMRKNLRLIEEVLSE